MLNERILIIGAVPEEIEYIKSKLNNISELKTPSGNETACGDINGIKIFCIAAGVGTVNTAIGLTEAISETDPDLIIQTGCAGCFRKSGMNIGDVCIATTEIYTHLGIEQESTDSLPAPLPFPVLSKNGIDYSNKYPLNDNLLSSFMDYFENLEGNINFKLYAGPFITVSTITATDKKADLYYKNYSPCMESMEGSSAAHTALKFGVPFVEIRGASNFVGKRERESWNMPLAFRNSNNAVILLLEHLANH